jgi:hypothetical protein
MNQFVTEEKEKKDMIDSKYENPGGKVFDLNHDLNQMVMFRA